jgi:tripartite ATP-independent transporter DctP family solute receptor
MSRKPWKLFAAIAAIAAFVPSAHAEPKHRFKLAHVIAAGTPIDVGARHFAELVKKRTNGEVEIAVFPASVGGERAIIEAVQAGTVEMSFTTTGAIGAFAPEFQVLDLPFLFRSQEAAYTYLDGDHGKKLLGLLERKGIHGVVFLENGWRNFTTSSRPLKRPEDLKGQKIRVMESPMYMGLVRTLNATPTPMAYSELPKALLQRKIDGQENPSVNIYSAKLYESQPFMIKDRHTYNVMILKVNAKAWNGLPESVRKVVEASAAEARDFQRKLNREADDAFVRKLQEKGMKVHEPSAEDLKAWQLATAPLYEDAKRLVPGGWVAETVAFRKDWDAGKYRAEEQAYVERFKKISVPLEDVMRNFK